MSKIFVRERTRVGKGAGRPRFVIVAVEGLDMKVYTQHIRKLELEKLAEEVGAEVVYLPRGEKAAEAEASDKSGKGKRRRKRYEE
jgi:hypothetical protein